MTGYEVRDGGMASSKGLQVGLEPWASEREMYTLPAELSAHTLMMICISLSLAFSASFVGRGSGDDRKGMARSKGLWVGLEPWAAAVRTGSL